MIPDANEMIASFTRPPVVEVVASARFSGMSDATLFEIGQFWRDHLRPSFSAPTLQPPYQVPVEVFDRPAVRQPVQFELSEMPAVPRLWFTEPNGSELLQVQRDWFAVNWRRGASDPAGRYDRWPSRRESFEVNWSRFKDWAFERGDSLVIDQCELTYINHIFPIPGVWTSHGSGLAAFTGLRGLDLEGASPEQYAWQAQYTVASENQLPPARLHLSMQPAFAGQPPSEPVLVLQITVRGAPGGQDTSEILRGFDRSRRLIVESFVKITAEKARTAWGQE